MTRVVIFLFDDVEVLDFAGPFEVFSTASRVFGRQFPGQALPFEVITTAQSPQPVLARGGLCLHAQTTLADCPQADLLLIPGGVVTAELQKPPVIAWIRQQASAATEVASVCTGAFLLGAAGLLEGLKVTTHWEDLADLQAAQPNSTVVGQCRWVRQGHLTTSAGISAGIDMSLQLVSWLAGEPLAIATARQMDYHWSPNQSH